MKPPAPRAPRGTRGSVLVAVVLMVSVVGAVAYLVSVEGASRTSSTGRALEAENTRYVAEAGQAEALWRLAQNTSCTGYTGLATTAFGPHSYQVDIAPTSGSPVVLNSTGLLSTGARSILRRRAMVVQVPMPLVLQPGAAGEDTYLWDGAHKDTNFGASAELSLDAEGKERTILLRFDLSTLPPGKLVGASLELFLEGGNAIDDGVIDLHRVTRSWAEGVEDDAVPSSPGATYNEYEAGTFGTRAWTSPGGDFDAAPVSSLTIPSLTPGPYQWDATPLIQMWRDGLVNHGMLLRGSGGVVDKINFSSGDSATASQHPKLTVTLACECGVDCGAPPPPSGEFVLSTAAPAELGGLSFLERDLAAYDKGTDNATLFLDGGVAGLGSPIDALHLTADGTLLLSTRDDATLGGLAFEDGDIVEYDPVENTATLVLEEATLFDDDEDVTALHLTDTGTLVLGTETDAVIGALGFTDLDLVEVDPVAETATLFFDPTPTTLDRPIDALHVLETGELLLSVDNDASLGGVDFAQGDLVRYDAANDSATLFFDASLFSGVSDDILSLHSGVGTGSTSSLGAIAHWPLDDGGGAVVLDVEGGHDGTRDGANWSTGPLAGALEFDGVDDFVDLTSDPELDDLFVGGATLSVWIHPDDWGESGYGRILDKSDATAGNRDGWSLALEDWNGGLSFVQGFSGDYGYWSTPSESIAEDAWQHVAVVYNASDPSEDPVFFIDGVEVALSENRTPVGSLRSDADLTLRLGNFAGATSRSFEGGIDDVRIFGRALSADEIVELAAAGGAVCRAFDHFGSEDYSGSGGDIDWGGPWVEVNESDGADAGDIRVVEQSGDTALRIRDNDGGGEGARREINLADVAEATLVIDTWRDGLDDADDFVLVEVSSNGGATWSELTRIEGPDNDTGWVEKSFDISGWAAEETQIRFVSSPDLGGNDQVYFDDVRIELDPESCP